MGRSVSYPSNALVAFNRWDGDDGDDFRDDIVEDLQQYAPTLWSSLHECDKWLGREDHAVLENDLVYVGVSEYCGLVAYWVVAKEPYYGGEDYKSDFAARWIAQIAPRFTKTFGRLLKLGTASNGESFFREVV